MKKWWIGLTVIFLTDVGYSQQKISFASIDWKMASTDAPTPDSLARIINSYFTTELEKVRAIYGWITSHIEYNTAIYKPWAASYKYSPDPLDTAAVWPSGDEMVARKVMRKRNAVCDGYARLFKVLCNYVGLESELIQGYASGISSAKFRTNHSWNAVKIDSTWHLVDVTWAAGHLNSYDDFVRRQNDDYFLTPPEQFSRNHYPEELRWTLLSNPPMPSEFKKSPFRGKNFFKYGIDNYFPSSGIIKAAIGDTLHFSFQLKDAEKARHMSNDPFMDTTTYSLSPLSYFIKPQKEEGNKVIYSLVVLPNSEWLHLLYNDDVVMRYRVNILSTDLASRKE